MSAADPKRGKVTAIEGPKGAGKTTLIRAIAAALPGLTVRTLPSYRAGGYRTGRSTMTPTEIRDEVLTEYGPDLGRIKLLEDCMTEVSMVRYNRSEGGIFSRSAISTEVYQREPVLHLVGDCRPDLVLYLDVPVADLKARLFYRDGLTAEADPEIIRESNAYQSAIRRAELLGWRIVRLDGTKPTAVLVQEALAAMGGIV